jgi:hypothetical protein
MKKTLPQGDYLAKLVKAQLSKRVEVSILRCTSPELNSVFVKVPRAVGTSIRYQIANGDQVFVVVNHTSGLKLCKVAYVTVCPNDEELGYHMRWAHAIIPTFSEFSDYHNIEMGYQHD